MTKKDYELLAKAIYGSLIQSGKLEAQDHYIEQFKITTWHVADALERNNPRFDRDRFISACGVPLISGVEV